MKLKTLILPLTFLPALSGCVVGAAVDLAATTVVTAGKLAVKGTGALIGAAIPDGDDKDKKDKKKDKKARKEQQEQPSSQYPAANPQPYPAQPGTTARYITIDAEDNAHETAAPYPVQR